MDDRIDDTGAPVSPAHRELFNRIVSVEEGIEKRNLEVRLERHMDLDHQALKEGQDALAGALLGPKLQPDFDGRVRRDEAKGIVCRLDRLEDGVSSLDAKISNGGVKAPLKPTEKAAIWVAAIGGASLILRGLIDAVASAISAVF